MKIKNRNVHKAKYLKNRNILKCPTCKRTLYISEYEPSLCHCLHYDPQFKKVLTVTMNADKLRQKQWKLPKPKYEYICFHANSNISLRDGVKEI